MSDDVTWQYRWVNAYNSSESREAAHDRLEKDGEWKDVGGDDFSDDWIFAQRGVASSRHLHCVHIEFRQKPKRTAEEIVEKLWEHRDTYQSVSWPSWHKEFEKILKGDF